MVLLDLSTSINSYGLELKEEDTFIGIANYWYESEIDKIKLGKFNFIPAVFFIGEPYNKDKYEKGEQPAYIPQMMIEAKEGDAKNLIDIDPEGLYEFTLVNIATIEKSFTNSKIILNENLNILNNIVNTENIPGITLEVDNETLIGNIKMKGRLKKTYPNNETIVTGDGIDINLISAKPLTPFKATTNIYWR